MTHASVSGVAQPSSKIDYLCSSKAPPKLWQEYIAMDRHKKMTFLSLDEKSYFVAGAKRGAIYDLKRGKLYALDENLASLFSWSLKGLAYQHAIEKVRAKNKAFSLPPGALSHLPFVRFRDEFKPIPSLNEVLVKTNEERQGVWLDVTSACNLRCVHCYARGGKPLRNELSLEEWKKVVDGLLENGFAHFTIGGGEPFFWPHILPFLKAIVAKKPASLTVLTNATLLKSRVLEFLASYQIALNITIFSHLAAHHDQITRVKGSWEKTVSGIKAVAGRGIPYTINIPLGAYNQNDLEETLSFLRTMGVKEKQAAGNIVCPLGRGKNHRVLPDRHTIFSVKREVYHLPRTKNGRVLFQTCWCGKLFVSPQGDVSPCPSARGKEFIVGNIRKAPLEEILAQKSLHSFWSLTLADVAACQDCEFRYACHDCRANAYIYSGNLLGKNPYCLYNPKKGTWMAIPKQNGNFVVTKRWSKAKNFQARVLGRELALLNEKSGAIHILNQIGAEIYNLLDGSRSFEEIVAHLLEHYEADKKRVRKDVIKILQELHNLGVITDAPS